MFLDEEEIVMLKIILSLEEAKAFSKVFQTNLLTDKFNYSVERFELGDREYIQLVFNNEWFEDIINGLIVITPLIKALLKQCDGLLNISKSIFKPLSEKWNKKAANFSGYEWSKRSNEK